MDLGLKNKIGIVAASARGLGKAVAEGLAREGVRLTICDIDESEIIKTGKEIEEKTGSEILTIKTDVRNRNEIKNLVLKTVEKFGGIDILVTNSGGPPPTNFLDTPDEEWQKAIELNLLSTIFMCKEVIPYMMKKRWGRIITMTSISVKQPIDRLILSNTVRTGVLGFTKTIATELAPYNILVNTVCPGYTYTRRIDQLVKDKAKKFGKTEKEILKSYTRDIPLGRMGTPEEFANVVVFLASEKASYLTGTAIQIDGGYIKGIL
ncbi:3-oxoacyl-ACP reductase [candidate division KSB1 bacterium]|nr:MAG: 3-oxoacyl-ACP reductase [candidate division KSB1 bacterium]